MKCKKVKTLLMILFFVLLIIILPILIAIGTSADILNWATNDNDWIEFWGGYVGTILGSVVTLFVMFRSLSDSRMALQKTLQNEKNIQKQNEILEFSSLLIEKSASYSVEIENMFYKVHRCIVQENKERGVDIERRDECLKSIRVVRGILIEISMHLEIVSDEKEYHSESGIKLLDTVEELIESVGEYNNDFWTSRLNKEKEEKIYNLSNELFMQTQEYLRKIRKER